MVTDTQERFDDVLNAFSNKLKKSQLVYEDGFILLNLGQNLLLRYGEVRKSRDRWKAKYIELKNTVRPNKKGYGRGEAIATSSAEKANRSEDGFE